MTVLNTVLPLLCWLGLCRGFVVRPVNVVPAGIAQPTNRDFVLSQGASGLFASSSSPSPSSSPSSSFRARRKKKKARMKRTKNDGKNDINHPQRGPLSLEALADHVSNEYIYGPGGTLRDVQRKRSRFSRQYQEQMEAAATATAASPASATPTSQETIRNLDRHPALVLNADFQPLSYLPLSLWHWQDTVKSVFSGKVTVVEVYPDVAIRAANLEVPLPSVIALSEYVSPQFLHHRPAFTKRNVFLRDEYRCQYCGDFFHTRELSLDHVVPRSKGGPLSWENAVTCCTYCNGRKGDMGLQEIRSRWGMVLMNEPRVPTQYELAMAASRMLPRRVHPTWEPYLPQYRTSSSGKSVAVEQEVSS